MKLHDLAPPYGSNQRKKRVGRGHGSGHVKTSGRGTKGQRARSGGAKPATFEGGQTRLIRRMPYRRGFRNARFKTHYAIINVGRLNELPEGAEVSLETLMARGWVHDRTTGPGTFGGLKVLGEGTLSKPLAVRAARFSGTAREKIVAAGGTAEELTGGSAESAGTRS